MASQIKFFNKNYIDLDKPNPVITITDSVASNTGQDSVDLMRNRNNFSGWLTTGSTDAANTEILIELKDYMDVDFIELVKHNFKNYLIEYNDSISGWLTYINVSNSTLETSIHEKDTAVNTNKIRITITGCQTVDADKELRQLIITSKLYQFDGWPIIKKPVHSANKKISKMLSGKININKKRGAFTCSLKITLTSNENDLLIHQDLYDREEGTLMLITGGDEDQFTSLKKGYRNQDIVLVKPIDEYTNPYYKGLYNRDVNSYVAIPDQE